MLSLVGLVPCIRVCHLLPALSTAVSPRLFPSHPYSFGRRPSWMLGAACSMSPELPGHKAFSRSKEPRYHSPLLPIAIARSQFETTGSVPCTSRWLETLRGRQLVIYAKSSIVHPASGPPHRSSSRTSPVWVISSRFGAPRSPRRKAATHRW